MAKYHCEFSTGEILEWEGTFSKHYWDILLWDIMTWWNICKNRRISHEKWDGSVIVYVDDRASFALTRTVRHPRCVIRLHMLQQERPIGNLVIRDFDYTEGTK